MMGWGRGDDLGGGEKIPSEPRLGGKEEVGRGRQEVKIGSYDNRSGRNT